MNELTSSQLSEWEAYDRIDPIGEWRNHFRFADLEALIINSLKMLYSKKGEIIELIQVKDLMPKWDITKKPEPKRENIEGMKAMFNEISKVSGNPIKTKKNEHR